jgi:hypothetical protein
MDGVGGACQAAARAAIHPQDGMLHALLLSARRRGVDLRLLRRTDWQCRARGRLEVGARSL